MQNGLARVHGMHTLSVSADRCNHCDRCGVWTVSSAPLLREIVGLRLLQGKRKDLVSRQASGASTPAQLTAVLAQPNGNEVVGRHSYLVLCSEVHATCVVGGA